MGGVGRYDRVRRLTWLRRCSGALSLCDVGVSGTLLVGEEGESVGDVDGSTDGEHVAAGGPWGRLVGTPLKIGTLAS